jgi:3'-phosphoadenosine 5'-phosphosulfate sulfotransferase
MTKLEHQGVKGMKWGKRKSYDKVGYMPGKIDKNRNKRLAEKRQNLDEIRRIKKDKTKVDRLHDLRRRNDEITSINNQADTRMVKSKRNIRNLKSIGAVAGTATSIYFSTPEGREKIADAANKVRSAYMR